LFQFLATIDVKRKGCVQ